MIEWGRQPAVYNQVVKPQDAAAMRQIMGLVTNGPQVYVFRYFAKRLHIIC